MANIADAIAYNNHDVDDGFRAGLLSLDQLREQSLFSDQFDDVQRAIQSSRTAVLFTKLSDA